MKKIVFILSLFMISFTMQSQEIQKQKSAKVSFKVDGICGMCKKRIETAALKSKGVKFAMWNVKTHQLNVIMDERKTDVETIQQSILAVGHDVFDVNDKKLLATKNAYSSVHPCCKYRDQEIILNHQGNLQKQKKH
ncbi:heavy-metal-associated domain-containing protein [uncultured Polaribacter sp.]|uniref:heavy-metal-associated domain-containing protein n=1 Tax=uncultured Polaribacter sp. TaxID=174711 RepID=UPI0026290C70|nr:heavy-metal-associated domain-containing protein [uncultured Polaribacter sp.]